jgi:HEAT repeat protein
MICSNKNFIELLMSEMFYRRQLQDFTHPDSDLVEFVRAMLESTLPIPEQLQMVLHLDDIEMQRHAITMTGRLEISELAPVLIHLYETPSPPDIQLLILEALGDLQDEQALQLLLSVLQNHPDTKFRMKASYAFNGHKRSGTVGPLLAIAQNTAEDPVLRGMTIEALAYQGDKSLLPQILPFLQDVEAVVRWDAVYTVGALGDASLASYIEPLLNDATWATNVQTVANEALEILQMWGVYPYSDDDV